MTKNKNKKISKKIKPRFSKKLPVIAAPVVVLPPTDSAVATIPESEFKKISGFPTVNVPTQNINSTTTAEQDLHSAGQRKINYIWEYTQAAIALITVLANIIYIFAMLFIPNISTGAATAATLLANAFFLVIGFYFGRTNHARMGENPKDTLTS